MAEKLRSPFKYEYQNKVPQKKTTTGKVPDWDATDELGRKIMYKGVEGGQGLKGNYCGKYNYVQSVKGKCGENAHDKKNRRLGCTRRPDDDKERKGDYSGVLMDMVVANSCDIRSDWWSDTLECVGLNPATCPALENEQGDIIEPRNLSNIEWKTKVSPPLMCSGASHVCVPGDCEYIENVNPGEVLCTYKALDTMERVKAYQQKFQHAQRGDAKRVMDAYCGVVLQPTEFTEAQKKLYGEDFKCDTTVPTKGGTTATTDEDEEGTADGDERAHQCTPYMGVGSAADFCRTHLTKHYKEWTDARDNEIRRICDPYKVCQTGQNDAECLHECACYLRAKDKDYPHGANPFKGSPDKCWWGPCKDGRMV